MCRWPGNSASADALLAGAGDLRGSWQHRHRDGGGPETREDTEERPGKLRKGLGVACRSRPWLARRPPASIELPGETEHDGKAGQTPFPA